MTFLVGRLPFAVCRWPLAVVFALAMFGTSAWAAPTPDSVRLARAKDYIADEQWSKAIEELRRVADDPKEANRDEALFWLAHSQHEVGDQASAIETIGRLERVFPSSRWVRPARSLRVEIAQRLNRDDLLWRFATPPPPPPAPRATPSAAAPAPPELPRGRVAPPVPPAAPLPPEWLPDGFVPDVDLRIQALGGLIQEHPARVIPLLKEIALDPANTAEGRRAVLVLAQSGNPQAQVTVLELARRAAVPVRIAAIRELGRFESAKMPAELLQIARAEADPQVRATAIITLGRAGGREQLRSLYMQGTAESKPFILTALFNARDEDELIRIASTEQNVALRAQARQQLQLLGTPKARAFLEKAR